MSQSRNKYWPGIILAVGIMLTHSGIIYATYLGLLSPVIAILLLAGTYHLAYTALHEATHGLLGKRLSIALGLILGQIMGVSFAAHTYLHNKSHHIAGIRNIKGRNSHRPASAFIQILLSQYLDIFLKKNTKKSVALFALCELIFILGFRLALINHAQNYNLLFVIILAPILGAAMVYLVFDYFVHRSSRDGRLTITHIFPEFIHKFISILVAFQNYHVVHHIEANTPFHLYPTRFEDLSTHNHLERHETKFWFIKSLKLRDYAQ